MAAESQELQKVEGKPSDHSGPDEERRKLFARLNHELRTPLNAITGFAELLELQPDHPDRNDSIQKILRAARTMLTVIDRELGEGSAPAEKTAAEHHTDRPRVLYVEDDPVNFALVKRILENRPKVEVERADCGMVGVEKAAQLLPQLILLDLNLPDIHGAEVLQRLQADEATASIPVVVISADATPSQIERLLTAGARNYLTKPFKIQQFLAVVDELLNTQPETKG